MFRVRIKGEKIIVKNKFHFDAKDIKPSGALRMNQATGKNC